jgi:exopolysaccharide biosynthesis protein
LSTLVVIDGKASVIKTENLRSILGLTYAISGVPVIIAGKDVSFSKDRNNVISEGYDGSELYATWHGFLGVKDSTEIVFMAFKTTTGNFIQTSEVYEKLKGYGFTDVIKLDGGGSFILVVDGKIVASTEENRRVNTIGVF